MPGRACYQGLNMSNFFRIITALLLLCISGFCVAQVALPLSNGFIVDKASGDLWKCKRRIHDRQLSNWIKLY
ncbi:MAG: hypothetical protein ACI9FD_002846 [Gammaproteobacteria bacterium]|jgi:hypothetical protein